MAHRSAVTLPERYANDVTRDELGKESGDAAGEDKGERDRVTAKTSMTQSAERGRAKLEVHRAAAPGSESSCKLKPRSHRRCATPSLPR